MGRLTAVALARDTCALKTAASVASVILVAGHHAGARTSKISARAL